MVEPYYELPMSIVSITMLRLLFQFRMGSQLWSVEQGWLARPDVPKVLGGCTFCPDDAWGDELDERHCVSVATN